MTKKDYELIAKILSKFRNLKDGQQLRLEFAQALKKENSNFNFEKFLHAANPNNS